MSRFIFELSKYPDNHLLSKLCTIIIERYNAILLDKIEDLDSVYIDFEINSFKTTLHQHAMLGIELFHTNLENPSMKEIELVKLIGSNLKEYIK